MSHRPLVFVSGLTAGDYLLWNWSLGGNHVLLALLAGLSLPPLAIVSLALLALSLARLILRSTRRPARLTRMDHSHVREPSPSTTSRARSLGERSASAASAGRSSSKLAA